MSASFSLEENENNHETIDLDFSLDTETPNSNEEIQHDKQSVGSQCPSCTEMRKENEKRELQNWKIILHLEAHSFLQSVTQVC